MLFQRPARSGHGLHLMRADARGSSAALAAWAFHFLKRYSLADLPVFLAKEREKDAGSVKPQVSAISAMLMLV